MRLLGLLHRQTFELFKKAPTLRKQAVKFYAKVDEAVAENQKKFDSLKEAEALDCLETNKQEKLQSLGQLLEEETSIMAHRREATQAAGKAVEPLASRKESYLRKLKAYLSAGKQKSDSVSNAG